MYIPAQFAISDRAEIFAFIEANAFGQLISTVDNRLFVTHLPFLVSGDRTRLFGHVARQNPQHLDLDGQEILVTFEGPHDYISPSWYGSPGVPTWNYQAVHVYGKCAVFNEPGRLAELVGRLTEKYESAFEVPWRPEYKATMLGAIVGIEILIGEVQGKFKLSQNRPDNDRLAVIKALEENGSTKLAAAMKDHKS